MVRGEYIKDINLFSVQSLATWESENKIYCQQTLVDGDGPKTYWTRELNGDELTLVSTHQRVVAVGRAL